MYIAFYVKLKLYDTVKWCLQACHHLRILSAGYVSAVVQYLVEQEILEAVRNMQLASIPDIWQQFWSGSLDSSEYVSFLGSTP